MMMDFLHSYIYLSVFPFHLSNPCSFQGHPATAIIIIIIIIILSEPARARPTVGAAGPAGPCHSACQTTATGRKTDRPSLSRLTTTNDGTLPYLRHCTLLTIMYPTIITIVVIISFIIHHHHHHHHRHHHHRHHSPLSPGVFVLSRPPRPHRSGARARARAG